MLSLLNWGLYFSRKIDYNIKKKIMKFGTNNLQKILKRILITNLLLASILLSANAETRTMPLATPLETSPAIPLATSIMDTIPTTTSNIEPETASTTIDSDLEISFFIKNKDFLILYGVTDDKNLNSDVSDLRKDFIEKFLTLKNDYEIKLQEKLGEKKLITPTISDNEDEKDSDTATSSVNKKVSKNTNVKKIKITNNINKIKNNLKTSSSTKTETKIETLIIDPLVNILNINSVKSKDFDGTIKIENKGWFGKLKAWFR